MVKSELLSSMKANDLPLPMELPPTPPDKVGLEEKAKGEFDALNSLKDVKAKATRYIEKKAIRHALNKTGWNKREAAKMLKISYKALFYKMNDYGLTNAKAE